MHETADAQTPQEVKRYAEALKELAAMLVVEKCIPAFVPISLAEWKARVPGVVDAAEIPNLTPPDKRKSTNAPITALRVERHAPLRKITLARAYLPNGWPPDVTRHIALIRNRYAGNNHNVELLQRWQSHAPADRRRCDINGNLPDA